MMLLQEPMLLALHFNQFQNVIYLQSVGILKTKDVVGFIVETQRVLTLFNKSYFIIITSRVRATTKAFNFNPMILAESRPSATSDSLCRLSAMCTLLSFVLPQVFMAQHTYFQVCRIVEYNATYRPKIIQLMGKPKELSQ